MSAASEQRVVAQHAAREAAQAEGAQGRRLGGQGGQVERPGAVARRAGEGPGDPLPGRVEGRRQDGVLLVGQRRGVGQRLGDARVDAREHGQHLVAHQVAAVVGGGVALVVAVDDAELATVGAQLGRPQAEQGPGETVLARPHGAQRRRRRVLDEAVEHGLGLVVAVVRGDDDVGVAARHDRARGVVAQSRGRAPESRRPAGLRARRTTCSGTPSARQASVTMWRSRAEAAPRVA